MDSTTSTVANAQSWVLNKVGIGTAEFCRAAFLVFPHPSVDTKFYYGLYSSVPQTPAGVSSASSSGLSTSATDLPWNQWDTYVFSGLDNVVPLTTKPVSQTS